MNNPFKSRLVRHLFIGWIFAIILAAIMTMLTIHFQKPSIVNEPMPPIRPVQLDPVIKNPPIFQLNTNWNTNFYGTGKTN